MRQSMKKLIALFISFLAILPAGAQLKWFNPLEAGFPVIQNQGFTAEIGQSYVRLPDRAKSQVRDAVWYLSRNSAGLAIHFYCNAPQIKVRYAVSGPFNMPHMPSTGVSGIDLYSINSDGKSDFCFGNYSFGDTIQYAYDNLGTDRYHKRGFEYRIYLPLYNSIKWMEIGIPENNELEFIPVSPEKPIVLYGTSIAQGACASRPAMAWSTQVQRSLGYPLINLGFSGNGQQEKEVQQFIAELDARLYILDCMPNCTQFDENEVTGRILAAVKQLREKHAAPILLIEHSGYSNAQTSTNRQNEGDHVNQACRKAYDQLQSDQVKDIYYLSRNELNMPPDGWVDYVHPSDLGMQQQATAIEKKIREILHIPQGDIPTAIPVTQRREPNNYEWQTRHRDMLEHIKTHTPRCVILGNSITHFWGGEPAGPHKYGGESWEKVFRPAGFQNMGYGWERIENVLWRVYHDELSGFEAEKVVLMIGTNNLGTNTNEDIVEGLRFLLSAIRERQPKADIKVVGILPRRNDEQKVKAINLLIKQMAVKNGYKFCDVGEHLLQRNGKIDETLFIGDGLHPNEKGYKLMAKTIAE